MPSDPLEQLLATAHATFCCLDDLRQTNQSITYLKGVVTGVIGTLLFGAIICAVRWML